MTEIFDTKTGGPARMPRGPRPWKALEAAIPIAKARGIIQMATGGTERIYDISIISKIPIAFVTVMFAPKILATIPELAEYYKNDLARLRLIARDAAVAAELWIRSRHGTWRYFLVTPSAMAEIDSEGKRIENGQAVSHMEEIAAREQAGGSSPA